MRVVFDTNVYISAFAIPGGRAEEAYLLAVKRRFDLFTSVAILTETAGKLRNKFGWRDARIVRALKSIARVATVLKTERINVLRDDPDNRILECAIGSQADFLVTGDRHLLSLQSFQGITIVTLADFLREGTRA